MVSWAISPGTLTSTAAVVAAVEKAVAVMEIAAAAVVATKR